MFEKIKEKIRNKKKPSFSKFKININIIIIFFISLLISIIIFKLTNNFLLTILSIFTIFICSFIISNQMTSSQKNKVKDIKIYNSFYDNFFYYSTINNSYEIGFKKAVEKLEISNLKDELNIKIENNDYSIIEPITRTREEVILIDDLFYNLKNDELIDETTLKKTESLLVSYKLNVKSNNYSNLLFLFLSLLILLISFIYYFTFFK